MRKVPAITGNGTRSEINSGPLEKLKKTAEHKDIAKGGSLKCSRYGAYRLVYKHVEADRDGDGIGRRYITSYAVYQLVNRCSPT